LSLPILLVPWCKRLRSERGFLVEYFSRDNSMKAQFLETSKIMPSLDIIIANLAQSNLSME